MGKRIHINLTDLIANPQVKVILHQERIDGEGDDISYEQCAEVKHDGAGLMFDWTAFGGEVRLEADFNSWSPGFWDRYRFIEELSCPFTVV